MTHDEKQVIRVRVRNEVLERRRRAYDAHEYASVNLDAEREFYAKQDKVKADRQRERERCVFD